MRFCGHLMRFRRTAEVSGLITYDLAFRLFLRCYVCTIFENSLCIYSGVARNFSQGCVTPIGSTLQSSTDALHCFCRVRNFDRRMRHHLPHFLNGNFTEVAEMHHGEHTTAAAHCWWQHVLLQLSRRRTLQVCRR